MTKHQRTHEMTVAEFCAAPEAALRLTDAGTTVLVERAGTVVATLLPGRAAIEGPPTTVREDVATYAVERTSLGSQQPTATALVRLMGAPATRGVLAVFLREPDRETHQREVARRAGVGLRSAQIALARLEALGLIESRRDGNRLYYRAARDERFEDLRRLLSRELGISEALVRHLGEVGSRIRWAFVYGSVAAGEDRLGSDVDVIVVGEVTDDELVGPIADAQRELGREVDVTLYRPEEFRRRLDAGNHFLRTTVDGPRIDLIGGPDDA